MTFSLVCDSANGWRRIFESLAEALVSASKVGVADTFRIEAFPEGTHGVITHLLVFHGLPVECCAAGKRSGVQAFQEGAGCSGFHNQCGYYLLKK